MVDDTRTAVVTPSVRWGNRLATAHEGMGLPGGRSHIYGMRRTVTMDHSGRVVVLQAAQARFGLTGVAHPLEIVEASDGTVLQPTGVDVPATRDASGWIVFHSDAAGAADSLDSVALVDAERSRRG
jgi:hypothetical protein